MSTKLPSRPLGRDGPLVPRVGLGFVSLSGVYHLPKSDEERLAFLDQAYERGETFWDTADEYKDTLDVLGKWFAANPEKRKDIFLCSKFGVRRHPEGKGFMGMMIDSTPEYAREAIDTQLKRLGGLPYIDLFQVHRVDKVTPIEKTIEALVELKKEGKIKYIGLSECSADTLRRACAVHPIASVQVEYNPFCTAIESEERKLLQTAREFGVAIVAYNPLANGIITGAIRTREDFTKPGDMRNVLPQLNEQNLEHNVAIVEKISEIAKKKGVTAAQLSIAWLLAQGDDVFPIPGTDKIHRLEENLGSLHVSLTPEEEKMIREVSQGIRGGRFQEVTGFAWGDTPPL